MSDAIDWKARCEKRELELYETRESYKKRVHEINELLHERDTLKAELGIARDDLRDEQSAARTDRNLRQRAEAELERVQKLLGETMDHVPSELRTRIVSAVADAQAKGLL